MFVCVCLCYQNNNNNNNNNDNNNNKVTYMDVVVDLTGVLDTLMLSVASTRSCHLES